MAPLPITGIQQIGIGVTDAGTAAHTYKTLFGFGALVFDDTSEAKLMTRYTGGAVRRRRALLTLNMQGGGGFEVWQFLDRKPTLPLVKPKWGDLGIYAAILKCTDVEAAHNILSKESGLALSPVQPSAHGWPQFWAVCTNGNAFLVTPFEEHFDSLGQPVSGVLGAVIGVSSLEKSLPFYRQVLGISEIVSDVAGTFGDNAASEEIKSRRVVLRKPGSQKQGAFGALLGSVQIELVERADGAGIPLYQNRFWGDPGFIHLCFDVLNMDALKSTSETAGFPFTVDSGTSFAMDDAAGRFCYVEDPDGTLIELVETHKVPVMKRWGLYLNLKKRGLHKPLPRWVVKLLGKSRVSPA